MTLKFILDENTLILAQKQENDRGAYDLTCLNLLNGILESRHSLVADYVLWAKYQSQLSDLPDTSPGYPHILRVLSRALSFSKIDFHPNAPSFPGETFIPQGSQDDLAIVRLMVATGATLVTTDNPLIEDLQSSGLTDNYQLRIVRPEQALALF